MTSYILDTNILSDLIDNPLGAAQKHLDHLTDVWVCTSIISAAELRYGAVRKQSIRLSHEVEEVLSRIEIVAFSPDATTPICAPNSNAEEPRSAATTC